ncbi:MAG: hypothetical protein JRH20_04300 [Deltaproteobacteria bacterium]|nr:hypothetical protein [Deltaproteobacteria bacterium]
MENDQEHDNETTAISWLSGGAGGSEPVLDALPSPPSMQILDALLEGGSRKVHALASTTLHRVIAEIGLIDAHELLELAEPEQVRELIDLEAWDGDRADIETLLDWSQALSFLSDEIGSRHLWGLDVELLAFLLRTQTRLYLAQRDELPEEAEGMFYKTPDGWFVIDLICENELRAEQLMAMIEKLYRDDAQRIRTLLQNVMWELPSELEEGALRWRTGRLEDLGFEAPLEALRVYTYLAPSSVLPDEGTADRALRSDPEPMGDADAESLAPLLTTGFFPSALAELEPGEQQRIAQALTLLANRVLSADRVNPTDSEHASHSLAMLRGRLSLGLEHICQGESARSASVLAHVALARIARVGHSLVLDAAQPARDATRDGQWGRDGGKLDLLPPLLQRQLSLLLASRPLLGVDDPPRPFEFLRDIKEAQGWIAQALDAATLVPLDARPETIPDGITLADLYRTTVVNRVLERSDTPLDENAVVALISEHRNPNARSGLSDAIIDAARNLMQERMPSGRDLVAPAQLVEHFFEELGQTLAPLSPRDIDLRFMTGLVFKIPEK